MAKFQQQRQRIRLYVGDDLDSDGVIGVSASQAHYLRSVMRLAVGDMVAIFNGRDGEWSARIDAIGKGWASLQLVSQFLPQSVEADIWLLFAPIKRGRTDFLIQKATELGVSALCPTITRRTVVEKVNLVRLGITAIEAAEQSRRLTVPDLRPPQPLEHLLASWPSERRLLFCDEFGGPLPLKVLASKENKNAALWAILVGPEGGFDPDERLILRECPFVTPMSLGPHILRTETAAIAALSIWQALVGYGNPQN